MTTGTAPVADQAGAAVADRSAGARHRLQFDRDTTFWGLLVPPSVWLLCFFLIPLILIAVISLRPDLRGGLTSPFTPTLAQYQLLTEKANYFRLLGTSIGVAFVVAATATVLAFPVSYFLAFKAGNRAGLYLALLLIPFWTSFLLRVMAWKVMLGSNGVINSLLLSAGAITEPLQFLLYNRFAVIVTLVYVWIPFVTLPILAALQRIDRSLFEAAADLGSTPLRRFWRITLPLALPGVLAGFFMCFIPTVGEYVTPLLVGGSAGSMYGNLIQDFFGKAANWPLGAAMSLIMLAGTLAVVSFALKVINPRDLV
ncbi:MAG: ABC transporter permease [Thermomicrobiales bacterium]